MLQELELCPAYPLSLCYILKVQLYGLLSCLTTYFLKIN